MRRICKITTNFWRKSKYFKIKLMNSDANKVKERMSRLKSGKVKLNINWQK
jgi:hypothetical protein